MFLPDLCAINHAWLEKYLPYYLIIFIIGIIIAVVFFIKHKKSQPHYVAKDALLTATEIEYYDLLCSVAGDEYLVFPQINLAAVIDKENGAGGRTELFRNVDFGIFDFNYKPLVLIEINDNSHLRSDRAERDKKVAKICKQAKIPLITFWVKDGADIKEMRKAIKQYIRV